jgi:hypothetical protein
LAEHRTTPLQLFSLRDLRAQQVRATSPSDHIPLGGVVLLVSEIEISEGPEPREISAAAAFDLIAVREGTADHPRLGANCFL